MPHVNPEILKWAREKAGLSYADAARRLGIGSARGVAADDRIRALETGEVHPTRAQLGRMSKVYHRPLVTFYLAAPPPAGPKGQDFRRVVDRDLDSDEPTLDALIRDVVARQELVRAALLEEDPDLAAVPFVGSLAIGATVPAGVAAVSSAISRTSGDFKDARDPDLAFATLRKGVEEAGVFVLLLGDLGSWQTEIDTRSFRGFAMADQIAPFIVINDHDSRGAWSFTLIHELTHILLGQTGVSGATVDKGVERYCNDVASNFLLPDQALAALKLGEDRVTQLLAERVRAFALERNVSSSMVAYRAYRQGTLTRGEWQALSSHFRAMWREEKARERARRTGSTSGPSYYVVRRHRLGALVGTVARHLSGGVLSTAKAGQVLGVKPGNVGPLVEGAR
ncbi:ImmA/IrrE family metallo-endopeptidase [Gaopeijia maritima]|uniref:ImmA/IrrE family metallo-endopeptidase n=1 Tax=Gaopeijia maritima TaxID=3119007 RepID=UPI0032778FA2